MGPMGCVLRRRLTILQPRARMQQALQSISLFWYCFENTISLRLPFHVSYLLY